MHRSPRHPEPRRHAPPRRGLAGLLAVLLLAAAAVAHADAGHDHAEPEVQTVRNPEVAGSRIVVSDADSPTVAVLDLASGHPVARFDTPGDAGRVYGVPGGQYALVAHRDQNRLSVIRTGLRVADHGDHQDLLQEAPYVQATMNVGRQPTHVFLRGDDIVIFNDADGTVALLDRRLLNVTIDYQEVLGAQPDHGAAVTLADHVLIGYLRLGRVDVVERSGERVASFEDCPRLHGQAVSGRTAAVGCDDGILLVHADDDGFHAVKIDEPARSPEDARVGTLAGHDDASVFVGNFGEGLLIADPATEDAFAVELSDRPVSMVFQDGAHLLVLTADGVLRKFHAASGETEAELVVVETSHDDSARPGLALSPDRTHAYVSDPAAAAVHEVDLRTFTAVRTVALPFMPAGFTVAAIPDAVIHDFGEHDHDHDHDEDDDHDHDH